MELIRQVTNLEVQKAAFEIGSEKSPGPDGMPAGFYQKFWHIVGPTVIKAVKSFFRSGKILKQINHTFITLLAKVDNPNSINHFRPISLCSTIYKIISKIITSRLKGIIPKLIHPLQFAFIKNRSIQDNILIGHEVFHSFRQKRNNKEGFMAIKLDMEKAYDKIDWEFLLKVMEKFGFDKKFLLWIKECITTVSFSVLVNNSPTEQFFPNCGLRQGDPLSPYLFILGAEVLSRMIQYECNNDHDIGVNLHKGGTTIPFLSFADDLIIFTKAKTNACGKIKKILKDYREISGQIVNLNKSAFQTTINVSTQEKNVIKKHSPY